MLIVGIDPGMRGAVALIYDDDSVFIEDMPILGKEVNGAALVVTLKEFTPDHAWLESVNSFGMGRQSAFNFGQGVGVIKGVLAALNIPYTLVTPATWKKHFKLGRNKDASRAAAIRLYPKSAEMFKLKKHEGRAEATLIAAYGKSLMAQTRSSQ